jgi:hypothetical protein
MFGRRRREARKVAKLARALAMLDDPARRLPAARRLSRVSFSA